MPDYVYVAIINNAYIFFVSQVQRAEPIKSELIVTTVINNLFSGPV